MNKSGRVLTVLLALFSTLGCSKLRARDQLNKGVQSYKNAKYEEAIEHFKNAVELDSNLVTARLYLATAYAQQYIPGADSPDNNRFAVRASLGRKPTDELKDKKACADLRAKNEKRVEDGIQNLQKSLQLRPDYDDAMAYLNLLYRQRAEYECEDPEARKADLKTADDWVDKTMATKKAKAEKAGPTGIITTETPR